jgi:hypothetical protein
MFYESDLVFFTEERICKAFLNLRIARACDLLHLSENDRQNCLERYLEIPSGTPRVPSGYLMGLRLSKAFVYLSSTIPTPIMSHDTMLF